MSKPAKPKAAKAKAPKAKAPKAKTGKKAPAKAKAETKTKAKTKPKTKPKTNAPVKAAAAPEKPARLGRGLSSLMRDIELDGVMDSSAPVPKAAAQTKRKASDTSKPKPKAAKQPQSEKAGRASQAPAATPRPSKDSVVVVTMDQLSRNPEQPRRFFDRALLDELADSISQKGILQPILVRELPERYRDQDTPKHKPAYQIVAGERRWQAALQAGLDTIPVFIRDINDQEALEIGVVENVQRADLNPMEEALAYRALIGQFGRSQEEIGEAVGKSRSYIANMLRLLNLPEKVQDYLTRGDISTGHARAIIAAPDPGAIADQIVARGLSVREAEEQARRAKNEGSEPVGPQGKAESFKDADTRRVEAELMDSLGLIVDLRHKGDAGEMRIKYKTFDQLENLIARLSRSGA